WEGPSRQSSSPASDGPSRPLGWAGTDEGPSCRSDREPVIVEPTQERSNISNRNERRQSALVLGVAAALALGTFLLYLAPYPLRHARVPAGFDAPWYIWRAQYVATALNLALEVGALVVLVSARDLRRARWGAALLLVAAALARWAFAAVCGATLALATAIGAVMMRRATASARASIARDARSLA